MKTKHISKKVFLSIYIIVILIIICGLFFAFFSDMYVYLGVFKRSVQIVSSFIFLIVSFVLFLFIALSCPENNRESFMKFNSFLMVISLILICMSWLTAALSDIYPVKIKSSECESSYTIKNFHLWRSSCVKISYQNNILYSTDLISKSAGSDHTDNDLKIYIKIADKKHIYIKLQYIETDINHYSNKEEKYDYFELSGSSCDNISENQYNQCDENGEEEEYLYQFPTHKR